MATAAVTHTFTAGTAAQAAQVNTNFSDLVSFLNNSVVHKDGSVAMTGQLSLSADPTASQHAARKQYVDNAHKLVGSALRTTDQTGITSETDITTMTTTWTATAGRWYRIFGKTQFGDNFTGANGELVLHLNGVERDSSGFVNVGQGSGLGLVMYFTNAISGSQTAKLRARRSLGSGSITVFGSAARQMQLTVEDMGL